jgi:hypothetical protein
MVRFNELIPNEIPIITTFIITEIIRKRKSMMIKLLITMLFTTLFVLLLMFLHSKREPVTSKRWGAFPYQTSHRKSLLLDRTRLEADSIKRLIEFSFRGVY